MNFAPVVIFVYNRPEITLKTVCALEKNFLSKKTDLFIFSDGPKTLNENNNVSKVRKIINDISGFKSIKVYESKFNKGLANSIINGVTKILSTHDKIIVLEDDLITAPNFLNFMNQALDFYQFNQSIFSISGYTMDLPSLKNETEDFYFAYRASSWGWGTWSRSWKNIDWKIKEYNEVSKSSKLIKEFNRGGSDMFKMLKNQRNNKIDSWAIRWCFNQFLRNQFTVFPVKSKIQSIGFGQSATHTKRTTRFDTKLDDTLKVNFNFDNKVHFKKKIIKDFKSKFSILSRIKDKFL